MEILEVKCKVYLCKEKYKKMDVISTLDIKMGKTSGAKLSYKDVRTTIIGIHNINKKTFFPQRSRSKKDHCEKGVSTVTIVLD